MKLILRVIAAIDAVAVAVTAVFVTQIVLQGQFTTLVRSGALGITTMAAWLVVLILGPIAAIQLWRLRRNGLFAAATLCGIALAYYLVGFAFLRSPQAPAASAIEAIVANGVFLAVLLSPAARRRVS